MSDQLRNWAGNLVYGAARVHRPGTVGEVRDLVRHASRIRPLGSRHSFNAIADTSGDLLSLERLNEIESLDTAQRMVTVGAGITYGTLCAALHRSGFALHNMASLPHISVAGACATATHGSGVRNGCLATSVRALELVTGTGDVVSLSRDRDGDRFRAAAVGLGALGVVTRLTLDVQPAFAIRQVVYEDLPLARLEVDFDAIMSSAYSVSLFTDWQGDTIDQVWTKERVNAGDVTSITPPPHDFFGASAATVKRHPIASFPADPCTEQLGVPGPWHERLPHFKMDFTPSSGAELQSEYFVARSHAVPALRAVRRLANQLRSVLQVSEVRTIAADDLWLSPYAGRDSVAFHFTWFPDWPAVGAFLPHLEAALAPFDARPHWGKLFTIAPERMQALYPRLGDFRAMAQELDPKGTLRNPFLDRYVFGDS